MKKLHAGIIIALVVVLTGLLTTAAFAAQAHYAYRNIVVSHVSVAGIDLSGMDSLAATSILQKAYDRMISQGLSASVNTSSQTISLFQTGGENDVAYNLIDWDPAGAATEALAVGHSTNPALDGIFTLYYEIFGQKSFSANVTINTDRLAEVLRSTFASQITAATPTDFSASYSKSKGATVTLEGGEVGTTLNIDPALILLATDAKDLKLSPLTISTMAVQPDVSIAEAEALVPAAEKAIETAPYSLSGTTSSGDAYTGTISRNTIMDWIIPLKDSERGVYLGLDATKMVDTLNTLHATIDLPAQNARFTIDGGKVSEFQASTSGTVIDDKALYDALVAALGTDTSTTPIVIATIADEPSVTTQNVNSLGISEIVGEATTSFKTSPTNRRANIKHGAEKLNGLLIAPGETVSLLSALKPFTVADGYLPELVIKGDEIKPEVGGGLCQIGTTAFRAVMHAGLEVVERRNHSLAVSYYNDPSNGNPGTDATIYDPSPDFKFKNDMPTYLLLVTTFDDEKSEITFTFWGTKDGRSGSYTPPEVLSRTAAGATQYKETTDLEPGKEQCQHAYPGYTTNFTYNVVYNNGTQKSTDFFSSYRALPQICLVGKAADTSTDSSTSTTESSPTP